MCDASDCLHRLNRRRFLGAAGAGAALAFGAQVPAWADSPGRKRLARFQILSDTHISDVFPATMYKMRSALTDLATVGPGADALVVVGDLVEYGHRQDYALFDLTLHTSPHPDRVVSAIGNHEFHAGESADVMRQRFLDYVGRRRVYFDTSVCGIPLVFVGSEGIVPGETSSNAFDALITSSQLDWLETTLARAARADRPTFVFLHQPPENVDTGGRLQDILRATSNVVLFWGHWHGNLQWLTEGPDAGWLGNPEGYWRVHTGAITYINEYHHNADGSVSTTFQADWRQGLLVDVYEDAVVVRGRDVAQHQWITQFQAAIPVGS